MTADKVLETTPGFSSSSGLLLPTEVEEVTPEIKQLIDQVSLELTKLAESFAASNFTAEADDFEFEYVASENVTTMLPPGLTPPPGLAPPPGLFDDLASISLEASADLIGRIGIGDEDENELQSAAHKMDGDESSDESTKADSQPDGSTKAESGSGSASVVSDDDTESNDEVPELPDLSAEALSLKKREKVHARKVANGTASNMQASTRIVFGAEGAKLAAQAAQAAKLADKRASWQPPSDARAYGWHPYYGYVAW
jgi:hypothetical protein